MHAVGNFHGLNARLQLWIIFLPLLKMQAVQLLQKVELPALLCEAHPCIANVTNYLLRISFLVGDVGTLIDRW